MNNMEYQLNELLSPYSEKNTANLYEPVAVGKYGIRKRSEIYKKELADDYSKNKVIYKDTLTIGLGSKQIDFGVLTQDGIYSVSPAYSTFRINTKVVKSEYLALYFSAFNEVLTGKYMIASARQGKKVDINNMLLDKVVIPDFDTQERIINEVDFVKEAKVLCEQQLSLYDELIKARFVEMFGEPEHNEKKWLEQHLEDLCEVGSSKRVYQNELSTEGIPFWRISDLVSKMDTGTAQSSLFIPEQKYVELKEAGLVPVCGDILVTSRGTLGRCYIIQNDDQFYFQDGMISWLSKYKNTITPLYLQYLFTMPGLRKQIDSMQAGSTVSYLSISMLRKLRIMVPDINLQRDFAFFVEQIDKSKVVVKKALDEAQLLFDSLMQQYFG